MAKAIRHRLRRITRETVIPVNGPRSGVQATGLARAYEAKGYASAIMPSHIGWLVFVNLR